MQKRKSDFSRIKLQVILMILVNRLGTLISDGLVNSQNAISGSEFEFMEVITRIFESKLKSKSRILIILLVGKMTEILVNIFTPKNLSVPVSTDFEYPKP
jgi:hypothetical protein